MRTSASVLVLVFCAASLRAQSASSPEARAAAAYDRALRGGPMTLRAFLVGFPKGADLHVHLSGAVYAETFIRDAAEDGICVDTVALAFATPPCTGSLVPATDLSRATGADSQNLYGRLIDSLSTRGFVSSPGRLGHDRFFGTFHRFGAVSRSHASEWVDELASRAAAQNEQYLEIMTAPPNDSAAQIARALGASAALSGPEASVEDFARLRQALLDRGLRDRTATGREFARATEAGRQRIEHCGTPQATAACKVEIRYLYVVLRDTPPEEVFAQALLAMETVQASMDAGEGGYVGINFAQQEDGFLSMRDYTLQMRMVGYLHSVYPRVHVSLHAGELAPGLVPPDGLRFHIRQAVEIAHAERIGHGVDVMAEDGAEDLLKEMAAEHVAVEINLTSNAIILGVEGAEHPLPAYRAAGVPVALSTDDEGVSRIDLTHEYVMAAREYRLRYADLKEMARTGMEHAFLPGAGLWARPDAFTAPVAACRGQTLGGDTSSAACKTFLDGSQKAAAQWELERRFRAFEAGF